MRQSPDARSRSAACRRRSRRRAGRCRSAHRETPPQARQCRDVVHHFVVKIS